MKNLHGLYLIFALWLVVDSCTIHKKEFDNPVDFEANEEQRDRCPHPCLLPQGSKAKITIPKETAMAEILIGETNLDIEKMSLINPSGSAFMFTVLDTAHGLKQFSLADYRGFDTLFVLNLPETDQEYFQA